MKKSLLIKLHLYSGLFTSFYLIAFGLSAIILNHKINVGKKEVTKTWETTLKINSDLQGRDLAENLRNGLGLMGWVPPWEYKRDKASFHFMITHPGRNYYVDANLKTGKATVAEAPKGFLEVFHGLHFFNGQVPNAPFVLRTWAIYQWFSLFVLLISLILGLWLWLKYNYKSWEGLVFGGLFIATIILMIFL